MNASAVFWLFSSGSVAYLSKQVCASIQNSNLYSSVRKDRNCSSSLLAPFILVVPTQEKDPVPLSVVTPLSPRNCTAGQRNPPGSRVLANLCVLS